MNIMTFNIIGCDNASKRRRISQIIQKESIDVYFIQETKIQDMTEVIVKGLWGYDPLGWSAKGEVGKFGGVLIVWKLGSITPNYSFKGRGFIVINA